MFKKATSCGIDYLVLFQSQLGPAKSQFCKNLFTTKKQLNLQYVIIKSLVPDLIRS